MSGLRSIRSQTPHAPALRTRAADAVGEGEEIRAAVTLPPGHPAWPRDLLSLTRRARAALAALPQVIVQALSGWDHPLREALIAGSLVVVEAAGTYRVW
ncbi:hypothetical protein EPN44_12230 [bacterium]|nr:MAG: hypothetical protein EPN44_12230 [bacterium]